MKLRNPGKMKNKKMIILSLAIIGSSLSGYAKVTLPAIFTDNMVLQQKTEAPIWGKATAQKKVSITTSWDNKTYTTLAANDGKWTIKVNTPVAGYTPYKISISDGKTLVLNNVLIGEVWICSGQSNMEMPLAGWGKITNYEQEIANANFPTIRLLHVKKTTSTQPLDDAILENGGWKECSPTSIPEFSSVAYFFGRNLQKSLNIPIGLINTSWGGTIAEAWTSGPSISAIPDFKEATNEISKYTEAEQDKIYNQKYAAWDAQIKTMDKGFQGDVASYAAPEFDDSAWKSLNVPQLWDLQDPTLKNFDGLVWFRKTIEIPQEWAGKDLKISLALIDDIETTYFNGVKIGSTNSCDLERCYTIPGKLVKAGQAVIGLKILDTGGMGGINGSPDKVYIGLSDTKKLSLAGTWKYEMSSALSALPSMPRYAKNNPNRPTVLFNAMINPLIPFAFQGAIWYQGESNDSRAYQYREVFPVMINDWRKQWKRDFPFYFVQLANFMAINDKPEESAWAELREAQALTLNLENTGMACITDIGDASDIHPKNKQEVGRRLALSALANTYGEKLAFSGPTIESYKLEGDQIRITFKHTNGGLTIKDGQTLKGFAIAGLDHQYHWADARIEGNDVVVSSKEVDFPVAVRYAWANNPVCNLFNGAGLPASPFRTDVWPGVTFGKK